LTVIFITTVKRILILSANPKDTSKLRLDEEVREIQTGLERAKKRDGFEIITKWAVRPDDLRRALLDYEPEIVHFSGHGAGKYGLALEDNTGKSQMVSTESLAKLFKLFQTQIECVLLNACYSEEQAIAIHEHINCVVGMNQEIGDRAAIEFATGFYDALGAGRDYADAFDFGCVAIDLESIPESHKPVLKLKDMAHQSNLPSNDNRSDENLDNPSDRQPEITPKKPQNGSSININLLEFPQGQVPLDSLFYIERPPIEVDCNEAIIRHGSLIRIKAPRQLGKTSLLNRILDYGSGQDYQAIYLDFQLVDTELLDSLDKFLQWFCRSISEELNLPDKVNQFWDEMTASIRKCTKYFERHLLTESQTPIVLGLDEVDEIFKHPTIASDFFRMLRAWHEQGKNNPIWQNLRLVIAHSQEVYIPLNINQSPFNVGFPIELPELNPEQIQDLIQRHGLSGDNSISQELVNLLGGHPYLLRVALYEIARDRITLDQLKIIAPTEAGPYNDHLRRHLLNLQEHAELQAAMLKVIASTVPVVIGSSEAFKLRSMGLVRFKGNAVEPACNLYRQYFGDRLEA
jgi:hypothetical protein